MRVTVACWLLFATLVGGCATRRMVLPAGAGTPLAEPASVLARVTATCRGVRTLIAELTIGGRMGGRRLRGRVHAGFARPASMRLEGVAPFGSPVFLLGAQPESATFLLPRQNRVLRDVPASAIVEALTGIALGADDLRAVLSGCVTPEPEAATGRAYPNGWTAINLRDGNATVFVRSLDGESHIVAATREALHVEYAAFTGGLPRRIRMFSPSAADSGPGARAELSVELLQVDVNTPLDASAFAVLVPAEAEPMTLEDLRRAGPLGQ